MLQLSQIRQTPEEIIERLAIRNYDGKNAIAKVLDQDNLRKEKQGELDDTLSRLNTISKEIGGLFKSGEQEKAVKLKHQTAELKEASKKMNEALTNLEQDIREILLEIPNVPNPTVPTGNSDEDNELIREGGTIPQLGSSAQPHWELAEKYDIIDFELGSKITGSGFPVYKNHGAKLQRALLNFFLDKATNAGYTEMQPPILVNEDSGYGTGQLPDKDGQMYHIGMDNYYLSPTAEVPLTNIFRNTIIDSKELPIKITAYTPCFRREAGSYGKNVKGLNRLHQFDKVEIVQITQPDDSYSVLESMCVYVEELLTQLALPYRIVKLCGGDLGFTSALTYDFEVYSAGQKRWLEVSSVSNFESFQANRLKLRIKGLDKKPVLAHTLNGSALAFPRILAALIENNQSPDGIKVPEVLMPYTGFDIIKI